MGQLAGQALRLPRTLAEDLGKKEKRNLFWFSWLPDLPVRSCFPAFLIEFFCENLPAAP
jgi:hypothetical protein